MDRHLSEPEFFKQLEWEMLVGNVCEVAGETLVKASIGRSVRTRCENR